MRQLVRPRFLCSLAFIAFFAAQLEGGTPCSGDSRELGNQASVRALKCRIDSGDVEQIQAYGSGLGGWSYSKLPSGIEEVILDNMDDPGVEPALIGLTRGAKYQTRELFEALGTRLKRAEQDWVALNAITRTDLPGIEAEVLRIAEGVPVDHFDSHAYSAIKFFGDRKYAPAATFLSRLTQGRNPGDVVASTAAESLALIGSAPAIVAVQDRLSWLSAQPSQDPAVKNEAQMLIYTLGKLPLSAPLDPIALKKTLSPELAEANQGGLRLIARSRHSLDAVPDLLKELADGPKSAVYNEAFMTLLGYSAPEVWRQARAELERLHASGAIPDDYFGSAVPVLDDRLDRADAQQPAPTADSIATILRKKKAELALTLQPTEGNGSVLIRAYDALSSYCDEGTRTDSRGVSSFRRCFSSDGRFNEWHDSSTDADLLARWGDGRTNNVWEGRTIAGVRVTFRYQQRTDGGMPFDYATGSDFPSRILDVFLMASDDRAAVIDGLSRFHAVEIEQEPGIEVFERLGEVHGRDFVSRELLFVRQSDRLLIEYQRF
ncbi:MAG TPA: hypothetical protein VM120_22570, partial [Bryobacteraceae bacterium]|nr:hypothetical protein [Bryobacteraceae bacterium]